MFERFTGRARKVVVFAQEEAGIFGHDYIGTEHLLLGLLREDEGVAAQALKRSGVDLAGARGQVESIVGYGEEGTGGQAPFTPRSKKVLEQALKEAMQLNHNYIGTEHLLLGLTYEREGVAARVLSDLDADPDKVRREVVRILGSHSGRSSGYASPEDFYRARVSGVEVEANFGATREERRSARTLKLSLGYSYGVQNSGEPSWIDHEDLIERAADALREKEFQLLETGVKRVGERILDDFPDVSEVTVEITAPQISNVSVSATFRQ